MYISLPARRNLVRLSKGEGRLTLVIRRIVGGILSDVVLLHIASITNKEHIIHLLLVLAFQILLLSGEPCLGLLQLSPQAVDLLVGSLALGFSSLHLLSQMVGLSLGRLSFPFCPPQCLNTICNSFPGNREVAFYLFQLGAEFFIVTPLLGNKSSHHLSDA